MMESQNSDGKDDGSYSVDTMESIVLDDSSHALVSNSGYKSAMSGSLPGMEDSHPLSSFEGDQSPEHGQRSLAKNPPPAASSDPLLEPPSYADVIFAPYLPGYGGLSSDGSFNDNGSNSISFSGPSPFSDRLTITVSDPQKVQDSINTSIVPGSNTYVTYLIATHTDIPQYGGHEFSVRRRFRDVVTLADRLAETYRGYFIPVRPEKSIVESQVMQKQEFVEQRRASLEKYLHRLANHPVIRYSDELTVFLQSQGKLPLAPTTDMASRMLDGAANLPRQLFGEGSTILTPQDVKQPAKGGRDLIRMFKELKQSVTVEWGGVKPTINEDDKGFLERKEKLDDLEQCLSEASKQAEILVKAQQDAGETMGELGLALIRISKFEAQEAVYNCQRVHSADAKRLATAAVKASRFYREANSQFVRHLDQLHEYLSTMQSIHTALNDRSNALLTVQTLLTEISSMSMRIDKLEAASSKIFGGDKTRNRKVDELKAVLKTTEEARDAAIKEYQRIKDINNSELERFDGQRNTDFVHMLKGFVHNQVGYAEKIASVWNSMAEECNPHSTFSDTSVVCSPKA